MENLKLSKKPGKLIWKTSFLATAEAWKMKSGIFHIYEPDPYGKKTLGNSRKLYPSLVRKSVVANHFCNRVVNVWNALPDGVVCAGSLPLFKKKLDENLELLTPFLKGRAFRNQ